MHYSVDVQELRKAMISADINTIIALSEASGVDRNTLGAILNNKIKPSSNAIEKIALALSLTGDDIGRIFFKQKLA